MTSLFTSSDDGDGVTRLVDILLGKLDGAHDKLGPDLRKSTSISSTASSLLSTQFEKLLHRHDIQQILQRIEDAIDAVEADERGERVQPADSLRIRAYAMTSEYQQSLAEELEEIEREKAQMEKELQEGWEEWGKVVEEVQLALDVMEKLGEGGDD